MDPAWAAIAAVVSPLVLVSLNRFFDRKVVQENWDRQDKVALRVENAAKAADVTAEVLLASNEAVVEKTAQATREIVASNELVAITHSTATSDLASRLDQIHTLVNSELTEAQRRELAATEALLVSIREVIKLKRATGVEPTVADEDGEVELEIRIAGMTSGLAAKQVQTDKADERRSNDTA